MERYSVEIERDPATGTVTYETWRLAGERQGPDSPAIIGYDAVTGAVVYEVWCVGGRRHREGAPAVVMRLPGGQVVGEQWWRHGLLHRDGAPAIVSRDPSTGRETGGTWWREGRWLRRRKPDRPALRLWRRPMQRTP